MRQVILGAVVGASLVYAIALVGSDGNRALAQRVGPTPDGSSGLIALPNVLPDGRQMLTVIDPRTRVIGTYQIEPGKGDIVLKGVRNITWDLQIDEYNGGSPSPSEVRALVEQR